MGASELARAAAAIANGQVGVTEQPHGSNSGPMVDKYLACVGQPPGNAWCAAFVCWCILEAADQLGARPSLLKSASALKLWKRNPHLQLPVSELTPDEIPCVAIWDHGGSKGHTGLVVGMDRDHLVTIEGNSDASGSRTGGSVVAQTKRRLDDPQLVGFVRIG